MYLTEILERDLQKIEFIKNVVSGIALMIVLLAVLWQTLNSAKTNPAEALKKE